MFARIVNGAAFQDFVFENLPSECREDCGIWSNSTTGCVESINQEFSLNLLPSSMQMSLSGNKFSLYLCLCSEKSKKLSDTCFPCISKYYCFTTAIGRSDYDKMCLGQLDIKNVIYREKNCTLCESV